MSQTKITRKQAIGPGWAVWILARFPGVRNHYQEWSRTKRIVIGILCWLVALPVIPMVVMAVMYMRDPKGFKKSPLFPIMSLIVAAWIGGFGFIANQTPVTDGQSFATVKEAADGEQSDGVDRPDAIASDDAKQKVANKQKSNDPAGRRFENCTAAFNEGVFNIKRNNPSYERRLDRDNDGIACEK